MRNDQARTIGRWMGVLVTALLAACGGGGGGGSDDLHVSVSYNATGVDVFTNATVRPSLGGFEGHDPNCSLASGSLPPGMQLQGDCSITGRPTRAGLYSFTVRVGADGATGTVDFGGSVTVNGPLLSYTDRSYRFQPSVGEAVNEQPSVGNWTAAQGEDASWQYSLASGALPPGLALDAATGAVAGIPTTEGSYDAEIRARLTTPYGSYDTQPTGFHVTVAAVTFNYTSDGGTGSINTSLLAYASQPFHASPLTSSGSSVAGFALAGGALPAGLSFDAATGRITGVPTAVGAATATIEGTVTTGATTRVLQTSVPIEVRSPAWVHYNQGMWIDVALPAAALATPTMDLVSPLPLGTVTRSYAPDTCALPPGVALDPATGVASGTPGATGEYLCAVIVTLTHEGVSWTQKAYLGLRVH